MAQITTVSMESAMARFRQYQISNFFSENGRPSQQQCNEEAERITGVSPKPTLVQGSRSYTVISGDYAVQFRADSSPLDLELLSRVQKVYAGFVPKTGHSGKLGELHIYKMEVVGGDSLYLARDSLRENECVLLRQTLRDFARFFASAWHNTPKTMPLPDRSSLNTKYSSDLSQLSAGLPERFRPILNRLLARLPYLLTDDWPLVPNLADIDESNIHADPTTGKLTGVCSWARAEISPFGVTLSEVENMLGIPKMIDAKRGLGHIVYYANHQQLRILFYNELYGSMGSVSDENKKRIEDIAMIGLFLSYGWQYDAAHQRLPAKEEDIGLQHIDAVLRATCDSYVGRPPTPQSSDP